MFRDDYTNFTFDDLRSENFKVWITNKGDLKRNMSPNFSDKFNTPTYGQIRYHEGTTIDKQDFKFSCVAVDVTLNEWRAITEWLSPLKSGKLLFDWNDKYYYMVKLSKAPNGTMFIKSKIDKTMGQLFIITFDLEFTTVYDWAAIGPYCEQKVLSDGNIKNLIDPSIYNNEYYIPQIIRKDQDNWNCGHKAQGYITTNEADYIIIDMPTVGTYTDCCFADGTKLYRFYRSAVHVCKVLINNGDSNPNNWPEYTTLHSTNDFYKFDLPYKNLYFTSEREMSYDLHQKENVCFCNCASFDMYPTFYAPSNFKVKKNDNVLYSYESNGEISRDVLINNQQFTFTCGGKSIEAITNYSGIPLFKNINLKSQLSIPSGRPELLKTIFVKKESWLAGIKLTFKINGPLIYDRFNPFVVQLFDNNFSNSVNIFNIDKYGDKQYFNNPGKCNIIVDPIIKQYYVENSGWLLEIYYIPITDSNSINGQYYYGDNDISKQYELNSYVYISLCDCYWLDVTSTSKWSVGCTTRDVI